MTATRSPDAAPRPSRKARRRSSAPPPPDAWSTPERAAWDLLVRREVGSPDDIFVERLACLERAYVTWGETGGADACVVRGNKDARITIAAWQRGTPRGRWSIAHELAHWLLHRGVDADVLARLHGGGTLEGREYHYEREADAFASELLMPRAWFAPRCDAARPTVDDLDALGAEYGTSLTAVGKRYARFATRAACALLECTADDVTRAVRSAAWRGVAVGGRKLEPTTAAAALARGERVDGPRTVMGDAWGHAELGDVEMTEHAIAIPESKTILVWLWHAGSSLAE